MCRIQTEFKLANLLPGFIHHTASRLLLRLPEVSSTPHLRQQMSVGFRAVKMLKKAVRARWIT